MRHAIIKTLLIGLLTLLAGCYTTTTHAECVTGDCTDKFKAEGECKFGAQSQANNPNVGIYQRESLYYQYYRNCMQGHGYRVWTERTPVQ